MGHTKRYAQMLSEIINVPALDTRAAITKLPKGSNIIFMGWIRIKDYMGYSTFIKRHNIKALCIVGAIETGDKLIELTRNKNKIDNNIPIFYLRGGFARDKVRGADRQMTEALVEKLAKKKKKYEAKGLSVSVEEAQLLNTLVYGGDYVEETRLRDIINWYENLSL